MAPQALAHEAGDLTIAVILGEGQARNLGSARPDGQIIETLGGAAGQQEAQEIPDDNQKKMREDPDPKLIR